ncbi:hypothetical protein CKAH01_16686 [Colletotrichum kahawae]|uniref:Uncharacterized protein n=1 Tax=Colletotrichum kahawae TaxID=34407 RepID=A0AAD9YCB0_COLKA|nr:hypothetical protein CKAH01_16686 [Colletotrichum kahawae]
MASQSPNDSATQQWYNIVKGWAGASDGAFKRRAFPVSDITAAPTAGRGIPTAVINLEIHNIADTLLDDREKWLTQGSTGSYFGVEMTYFNHIITQSKSGGRRSSCSGEKRRERVFEEIRGEAYKQWRESAQWDSRPCDSTWIINNRPDVLDAEKEFGTDSDRVAALVAKGGDPDSEEIRITRQRLTEIHKQQELPGFTFKASIERFDPTEYFKQLRSGGEIRKADESIRCTNLPSYNYPNNYANTLERMYRSVDNAGAVETRTIEAKTGSHFTDHSNGGPAAGQKVDDVPWLRVRDVPGYRSKFPYVGRDPLKDLANAVRPSGILIGQGLKFKIIFKGQASEEFKNEYNKVKEKGGSLSIFGLTIQFNNEQVDEHTSTGSHKFDENKVEVTVEPARRVGDAILLAVVGATE